MIFPEEFINKLILGDCLVVMKDIPDSSIDIGVTSPPYFVEKEYEKKMSFEDYDYLMSNCFKEVLRILKPGGYFVINFGDYFNSGNRFYNADVPSVYPASINMFNWGRNAGFDLQATRVWRKQFARMGIPFVCNHHPRNIFDYEHIWTFRKPGCQGKEIVRDRKLSQRGVIGENWKSSAKLNKHCAAYPVELPMWCLDVYSDERDIIIDPFSGLGTTAEACIRKKRQYVCIELNEEYFKLARDRISSVFM